MPCAGLQCTALIYNMTLFALIVCKHCHSWTKCKLGDERHSQLVEMKNNEGLKKMNYAEF